MPRHATHVGCLLQVIRGLAKQVLPGGAVDEAEYVQHIRLAPQGLKEEEQEEPGVRCRMCLGDGALECVLQRQRS